MCFETMLDDFRTWESNALVKHGQIGVAPQYFYAMCSLARPRRGLGRVAPLVCCD